MSFLLSTLMPSGMTMVTGKPRRAPTHAQDIPAFPVDASTTSIPGLSSPLSMALLNISR